MCLVSSNDDPWLRHCRLGHINMKLVKTIYAKENVQGLSKLTYFEYHICEACELSKQVHASHKPKFMVSISRPLELLRMDLVGCILKHNMGSSLYIFFCG